MKKIWLIVAITIIYIYPRAVLAAVSINEIYPAPKATESEYVELFNDGSDPVFIGDLTVTDGSGKKLTVADDWIDANGYTLATSSAILNNSGDTVTLLAADHTVLQSLSYPSISTGVSYSKCLNEDRWSILAATPAGTNTPCVQPTPTAAPVDKTKIWISEAMPYPETGESEWVELYNDAPVAADLDGWQIDDAESGSSPKTIHVSIAPHSFSTIDIDSSMFNNAADDVRLLDEGGALIDKLSYQNSVVNLTVGHTAQFATACNLTPTKNNANGGCVTATPTAGPTPTPTPRSTTVVSTPSPPLMSKKNITITPFPPLISSVTKASISPTSPPLLPQRKLSAIPAKKPVAPSSFYIVSLTFSVLTSVSFAWRVLQIFRLQ